MHLPTLMHEVPFIQENQQTMLMRLLVYSVSKLYTAQLARIIAGSASDYNLHYSLEILRYV